MKLKMYAVFDDKARAFLPPFFLPEQGMAVRAFSDCCIDAGHAFGKHPADYTLFYIGEFDCADGAVVFSKPLSLGNGLVHSAARSAETMKYMPAAVNGSAEVAEVRS